MGARTIRASPRRSRATAIAEVPRATIRTCRRRIATTLLHVRCASYPLSLAVSAGTLITNCVASRPNAPQLPPIQSNMSPESFYPQPATAQLNAVYNREQRSPRTSTNPNPPQLPAIGRGPVPQFEKCANTADLKPKINAQPPFRRANPEGGFISVSSNVTLRSPVLTTRPNSLYKRSHATCLRPTNCAIMVSTIKPPATRVVSSRSLARASRMMGTITRIAITSSTSTTYWDLRNQGTRIATSFSTC